MGRPTDNPYPQLYDEKSGRRLMAFVKNSDTYSQKSWDTMAEREYVAERAGGAAIPIAR
jgi:hypothetical protein